MRNSIRLLVALTILVICHPANPFAANVCAQSDKSKDKVDKSKDAPKIELKDIAGEYSCKIDLAPRVVKLSTVHDRPGKVTLTFKDKKLTGTYEYSPLFGKVKGKILELELSKNGKMLTGKFDEEGAIFGQDGFCEFDIKLTKDGKLEKLEGRWKSEQPKQKVKSPWLKWELTPKAAEEKEKDKGEKKDKEEKKDK